MQRREVLASAVGLLLALALPAPSARGEEARAGDVYVRRRTSIANTVAWLAQESRRQGVGQLLLVFDAATFAPPPGATEFSLERLYLDDLPAWIDAIGNQVAAAGCPIRATSSLAPKTVAVGAPGWEQELYGLVTRSWWDDAGFTEFEPAARWVNRLLLVTESGIRPPTGSSRRLLAFVSGTFTPERWVSLDHRPLWEQGWRRKLRAVGTYWDEEAIAARLERDGCLFYAIAPEAHFCDFRPFVELPELPWAARPQYPPLRFGPTSRDGALTPSERGELDGPLETAPTERPRTPSSPRPLPPGSGPPRLHDAAWRFDSWTPHWFPRTDQTLLVNNHAPSGYGSWPLARVAAKTGGRYFFYPFPATRWLDRCPADPVLLDRLAPDLVHKATYLARLKNDAARDAVVRATNLVLEETPWADQGHAERTASGWSTFWRIAPLAYHAHWFLRRKPYEVIFEDPQNARMSLLRTGARLRDDVLPRYDRAMRILDEAIVDEMTGVRTSHPRAVADLVLARYWFAMSAFHLEAFSIYGLEIERFIPERLEGRIDRWWVVYIPTIKMSDCLPAYDGRELSEEAEATYERWVLPDQPGMQGNILLIDPEHADYRARRRVDRVLENLDPRLRRRALDMIHAARRVMADYAQSGWGWTTYYSIAYTFIFKPLRGGEGPPPARPGDREPPRPPPTTPRGPDGTPQGSEPGGPATGR